jgi:choline kinase
MVGYGAERVEATLADLELPGLDVATAYNPFSETSDNLMTAWLARPLMTEDFLLLNGDTLFDDAILNRLVAEARGPVTMAMARKRAYDDDDMKVVLDGSGRLQAIGKALPGLSPDGEAIGMTLFRGEGIAGFRQILDEIAHSKDAQRAWYTAALDGLADRLPIQPVATGESWWAEVDTERDLLAVRDALDSPSRREEMREGSAQVASFL